MDLITRVNNTIQDIPDFPKPGIIFKDIAPILADAALCKSITDYFCALPMVKPDAICAIESRGFFFGILIAQALGVPLVMIRKKGKLPGEVIAESYNLEYGSATIEIQKGAIKVGQNIWLHDDVLATGGTAAAAAKLIESQGANLAGFIFLMELEFLKGADLLKEFSKPSHSLVRY
jgi:adenine phosphoribosyltransferase